MRALVLVLLTLAPFTRVARADEPASLAELLHDAEQHYPSLRARSATIAAAQARLSEAYASPFMQFTMNGGFSIAPRASGTSIFSDQGQLSLNAGVAPVVAINATGVIPLYTFGKLRTVWRLARQGVVIAELDRERATAVLREQVRSAYYSLQLALDLRQMIGEAKGHLASATEALETMLEEENSEVDPLDRFRLGAATAEIDARESEIDRLENSARAALHALTGRSEIAISDCPIRTIEFETDAPIADQAAEQRAEVRMLHAAAEARRLAVQLQRQSFAPDIGLGVSAGFSYAPGITNQNNPFIADAGNSPSLGAGLVFRWNLDFLGNYYRVARTRAELQETEAQVEEVTTGVRLEAELGLEAFRDAKRREVAWGRSERESRALLVSSVQSYEVGATEASDLVDALKGYFQARYTHLRAVYEINVALAGLDRMAGGLAIPAERWDPTCE